MTPRSDVQALRCLAIYGANASGKTNILRAMRVFSHMISASQRRWKPTGPVPSFDPFLLDEASKQKLTTFDMDFVLGTQVFNYGFSFGEIAIEAEWLVDITQRERVLFRRTTKGLTTEVRFPGRNLGTKGDESKRLDAVASQTRPNSLFLSAAAQNNVERLNGLYKWLTESFFIISPRDQTPSRVTAEMCSKPDRKAQIRNLLEFADTGIVDFEVEKEEAPEKVKKLYSELLKIASQVDDDGEIKVEAPTDFSRDNIRMIHGGADGKRYSLNFDDESAGTRAYFFMLGPILSELDDATTVLIDELEASLHPNLARQLVKIFNDRDLNPKGAQLIFATHDTHLLDFDLLRRDQVWFATKNHEGSTSVVQLADFKPRLDQNVASAYLNGRFGAIPFLDDGLLRSTLSHELDLKPQGSELHEQA